MITTRPRGKLTLCGQLLRENGTLREDGMQTLHSPDRKLNVMLPTVRSIWELYLVTSKSCFDRFQLTETTGRILWTWLFGQQASTKLFGSCSIALPVRTIEKHCFYICSQLDVSCVGQIDKVLLWPKKLHKVYDSKKLRVRISRVKLQVTCSTSPAATAPKNAAVASL